MEQLTFNLHFSEPEEGRYRVRLNSTVGQATEPCDLEALEPWLAQARSFIPDDREVWRSGEIGHVVAKVHQQLGQQAENETAERGEALYRAVFHGEINRLFERARGLASGTEKPLRIQFEFELDDPAQARLATLPWETLRDPSLPPEKRYLAQSEETPIVRLLSFDGPVRRVRLPQVLKVLAVAASPANLATLDLSSAVEPDDGWSQANIVISHLLNPTRDQLRKALNQGVHVLHFDGHGRFSPVTGVGEIALIKDKSSKVDRVSGDNVADWVSGASLAEWLLNNPGLRLVVLNACSGGADGGEQAFAGVASALVRGGVASVIAMQRIIPDPHAVEFARSFYERLTQGHTAQASLSAARHELAILEGEHWSTPLLYTHTDDIFHIPTDIRPTLTRVFSWLGVITANIAVNAWSRSQGGPALPGLGFNEVHEQSVPVFGVLIVAPLLILLLWIVLRYQGVTREQGLFFRLPIAFGLPIENNRRLAILFQTTMLAVLIAVPLISQAHFLQLIHQGSSWEKKSSNEFAKGWTHWQRFEPPVIIFQDKYRFGPKRKDGQRSAECSGSAVCEVSFFPFWQPWLYLLLYLTALVMFLMVLHGIWSKDPLALRTSILQRRYLLTLVIVIAVVMTISAWSYRLEHDDQNQAQHEITDGPPQRASNLQRNTQPLDPVLIAQTPLSRQDTSNDGLGLESTL